MVKASLTIATQYHPQQSNRNIFNNMLQQNSSQQKRCKTNCKLYLHEINLKIHSFQILGKSVNSQKVSQFLSSSTNFASEFKIQKIFSHTVILKVQLIMILSQNFGGFCRLMKIFDTLEQKMKWHKQFAVEFPELFESSFNIKRANMNYWIITRWFQELYKAH